MSPTRSHRRLFAISPLALAVQAAVFSAATLALPSHAAEPVQAAATARSYQIPAGPLASVLARFAAAAGVALSFDPALAKDLPSAGLQGRYTVHGGFAALLTGSGLEALDQGGGAYTLRTYQPKAVAVPAAAAATVALPAVTVTAAADHSGTSEGTGSYATGFNRAATGLNLSLRETPQSISVVTRQRMDDQGLNQLSDVLQQTTGLVVDQPGASASDSSKIYSRGFAVDTYQIDGITQVDSNYDGLFQTDDMVLYDRAEVVRGASGMMSGVGSPGAAINLVRKRPTDSLQASAKLEAGSWNKRRAELDLSAPLNQAGSLRGRVVGAWQDNDSYVDRLHERKEVFYGILEADIAPATLLSAGFSSQRHDTTGVARSGLPLFNADGSLANWSRSASAAASWTYTQRHNQSLFASLEHRFHSGWVGKASLTHNVHEYDEVLGYAGSGNADPATGSGIGLWAARWAGKPAHDSLDVSASGPFELLGRRHDLAFGATTARTRSSGPGYSLWRFAGWSNAIDNITTWDGSTPAAPANPAVSSMDSTERTESVYSSVRFKPTDALSLLAGVRTTRWGYDKTTTTLADGSQSTDNRSAHKLTPFAGVVYDFDKHWSAYASYTNNFKPQSYARDASGSLLDPQVGKGVEIGSKAELFNKRLNLSAAIYQTKQDNLAEWVRDDIYRAIMGVTTRGFEAEASGELARDWQASIGFSRNLSRDGDNKPVNTDVPHNSFKLFSTYKVNDIGAGLTVGGGLRWQSRIYRDAIGPNGERATQGSYAVADAMLRYAINRQVEVAMNLNNLFDRSYHSSAISAYAGAPRNLALSLRWQL
jgi:outer membrane receptor for ferric coprogen and ferric-rhodotorulic acid